MRKLCPGKRSLRRQWQESLAKLWLGCWLMSLRPVYLLYLIMPVSRMVCSITSPSQSFFPYLLNIHSFPCWRRQWHPTPVLLPGKSHGWRRLVGCSPWGRQESDTTERLHFHALEKEMATHSSVLAWRIPGTGEPGGLPSLGSHRVGHDWSDLAAAAAAAFHVFNKQ